MILRQTNSGGKARSAPGFVLLELVAFVVLLTALSVLLLPMALEARQKENENHAREYLRMIAASQQVWHREIGSYTDVRRLTESVPNPPEHPNHLRTPGLAFSSPLIFDGQGIAHRGGYRFRVGVDADSRTVGCWAWPNLRDYSGYETYWIDFETGKVWVTPIAASWNDTPGSLAPEHVGLRPVGD